MKMIKGHYWIKTVTILRGGKEPHKTETKENEIGYYEGDKCDDGTNNTYPWLLMGSDEIFKTYETDEKVRHRETHVIAVKRIENYNGEGK